MKLAIVSDIHSNYIALESCMEHINKNQVDQIILLGDYVSDCPKPEKTMELLRKLSQEYCCHFIRGNREEYFLDYADGKLTDWKYSSYKGSLLYTFEHLTTKDLDWFRNMPSTDVIAIKGTKPIRIAHGSPDCAKELLDQDQENTKQCLKELKEQYLICGHTHRQMIYKYDGKCLINPGSVGVAIGVKEAAHMVYLTYKEEEWHPELVAIPYDYEQLKREFYESHLMDKGHVWPLAILKSIETGINFGPLCAKRAYDMAVLAGETITDRIVPECYWEKAFHELCK